MLRPVGAVAAFLLAAVCVVALSGCAGTGGSDSEDLANDPVLIRKEIAEIDNEIVNTEEIYKASLTALQMEEDAGMRDDVNRLWIELEHLRSRKAALEERLAELEAAEKG
jgi:hypothetical protein